MQEPWAFDAKTLDVLRTYIRLRYRLRPYLYQLFAEHERTGEAILRPLFYDFEDRPQLPLGLIDDQFLVGPHILQAPFVVQNQASRAVVLPGKIKWYDVAEGRWIQGDQKINVTAKPMATPLYIRDGAILPLARLAEDDHAFDGKRVDFHVYLSGNASAKTHYVFDDGHTFAYEKQGKRSAVDILAQRNGTKLILTINVLSTGYGQGDFTFTTERTISSVIINGVRAKRISAQGVPFGAKPGTTWRV